MLYTHSMYLHASQSMHLHIQQRTVPSMLRRIQNPLCRDMVKESALGLDNPKSSSSLDSSLDYV